MIKPMARASIAAARRFIQAKGWRIDGNEVILPPATEGGDRQRVTLKRFCQEYGDRIRAFNTIRLKRRKKAIRARPK